MSPSHDPSPDVSLASAVQGIEQDFARILENLAMILEAVDPADSQVTARVHAMIELAHRGIALSHQLRDVVSPGRS